MSTYTSLKLKYCFEGNICIREFSGTKELVEVALLQILRDKIEVFGVLAVSQKLNNVGMANASEL